MKRIYFTVTNELTYDQRMHRICGTLAAAGYEVHLVGRKLQHSLPLSPCAYQQHRLRCWFTAGKAFYTEFNIRLFFYLLFRRMDALCSIDLDTILPGYLITRIKRIPGVYDAHELFTELKEVIARPAIHRFWLGVEKRMVPRFKAGYTVSEGIAAEFNRRYGVHYPAIRNMPLLKETRPDEYTGNVIIYQGAVNEGRGFEYLIPAMQQVNGRLIICGDGNFMPQLKVLIQQYAVGDKTEIRGMLTPAGLIQAAASARVAVAVPDREGLNQLLALPNKFFDYIHAELPQVTVNFPEYARLNAQWEVALLLNDRSPETIAAALNLLLDDRVTYGRLRANCQKARKELNWQQEEQRLLSFYKTLFNP